MIEFYEFFSFTNCVCSTRLSKMIAKWHKCSTCPQRFSPENTYKCHVMCCKAPRKELSQWRLKFYTRDEVLHKLSPCIAQASLNVSCVRCFPDDSLQMGVPVGNESRLFSVFFVMVKASLSFSTLLCSISLTISSLIPLTSSTSLTSLATYINNNHSAFL